MSEKYGYSRDEEMYHGDFDTPEEAANEGLDVYGQCWVGRYVAPPAPEKYFDIDDLIDTVSCQDEYCGEWACDWFNCTKEQRNEINSAVQKMIGEWFDKHELRATFHNVVDAEEWVLGDDKKPMRAALSRAEGK